MIQFSILQTPSEKDALELTTLLRQLSLNPDSQRSVNVVRLNEIVSRPTTVVIVLRDDDRIVGTATLLVADTLTGTDGEIEDVVVLDEYRGQGLGRKLVEAVIEEARKRNIATIYLTSRPARVAANKLYQSMGFKLKETNAYELDL